MVVDTSTEVLRFYEALGDSSSAVFPVAIDAHPPFHDLPANVACLVKHCIEQQYSKPIAIEQYKLALSLTTSDDKHSIENTLANESTFYEYLRTLRQSYVQQDGWRRAHIITIAGVNSTGVFRDIVQLARREIDLTGGVDALMPYSESNRGGVRVWSQPTDADCFQTISTCILPHHKLIAFDLYCDVTCLGRNDSQSISLFRLRFVNLRSRSAT